MGLRTGLAIGALLLAAGAVAIWSALPQGEQGVSGSFTPTASPVAPEQPSQSPVETLSGAFTLAVSWQPAFCETASSRPECRSQTDTRFDATNFSLHGLWPEPRGNEYCGVPTSIANADRNGQWRDLPGPELTDDLWDELQEKMPGTQSLLHRHEWIKHGTCANVSAEAYYAASLDLLDALNASGVATLFADHIGDRLSAEHIRAAFDQAFGRGAGTRVTIECERENGRTMVSELRIGLSDRFASGPDLGALIAAAPSRSRGCPGGEIDRAGRQ